MLLKVRNFFCIVYNLLTLCWTRGSFPHGMGWAGMGWDPLRVFPLVALALGVDLRQVEECVELLVSVGRIPEATFMARTYLPSAMSRLVAIWKKDLSKVSTKVTFSPGSSGGAQAGS